MNRFYWSYQSLRLGVFTILLSLSGCGLFKAEKPPVDPEVLISIEAGQKVNPNSQGRPSPIFVRVYRLKNSVNFLASDYFSLLQKDQNALGADIVFREEVILNPGQAHIFKKKWSLEPGYFAVVAAFRDLDKSVWRVIQPYSIQPSAFGSKGDKVQEQKITVVLDNRSIVVQ
jgi:type VI secretion system protein VasD